MLTRATIRSQPYFSFATWQIRMLSSSSPVTAITRSARWIPARSRTHSSVASPYCDGVLELLLDDPVAAVVGLDQRDLSVLGDQLSGEVPADLAGPGDDHVHRVPVPLQGASTTCSACSIACCVGQIVVQPLLGVPAGARRVGDADDDARHVEAALRELRNHEVRVVAPRRGHEHVRILDASRDETVDLERSPDREAAAGVLPARRLVFVETLVRQRVAVEYRYIVPHLERALGDGRTRRGRHRRSK